MHQSENPRHCVFFCVDIAFAVVFGDFLSCKGGEPLQDCLWHAAEGLVDTLHACFSITEVAHRWRQNGSVSAEWCIHRVTIGTPVASSEAMASSSLVVVVSDRPLANDRSSPKPRTRWSLGRALCAVRRWRPIHAKFVVFASLILRLRSKRGRRGSPPTMRSSLLSGQQVDRMSHLVLASRSSSRSSSRPCRRCAKTRLSCKTLLLRPLWNKGLRLSLDARPLSEQLSALVQTKEKKRLAIVAIDKEVYAAKLKLDELRETRKEMAMDYKGLGWVCSRRRCGSGGCLGGASLRHRCRFGESYLGLVAQGRAGTHADGRGNWLCQCQCHGAGVPSDGSSRSFQVHPDVGRGLREGDASDSCSDCGQPSRPISLELSSTTNLREYKNGWRRKWMNVVRKLGRVTAGNQEQQNQKHKDATVCRHRQRETKKGYDRHTWS